MKKKLLAFVLCFTLLLLFGTVDSKAAITETDLGQLSEITGIEFIPSSNYVPDIPVAATNSIIYKNAVYKLESKGKVPTGKIDIHGDEICDIVLMYINETVIREVINMTPNLVGQTTVLGESVTTMNGTGFTLGRSDATGISVDADVAEMSVMLKSYLTASGMSSQATSITVSYEANQPSYSGDYSLYKEYTLVEIIYVTFDANEVAFCNTWWHLWCSHELTDWKARHDSNLYKSEYAKTQTEMTYSFRKV